MAETHHETPAGKKAVFQRRFLDPTEVFFTIGRGEIGGKARGLANIKEILGSRFGSSSSASSVPVRVEIPHLIVITTDMFDRFMSENGLQDLAASETRDDRIAHAFQRAALPAELVGDLRALMEEVHSPLAIRSSSFSRS